MFLQKATREQVGTCKTLLIHNVTNMTQVAAEYRWTKQTSSSKLGTVKGCWWKIKKERLIKVFHSIQPEGKTDHKEICMELATSVLLLAGSIIDNLEQRTLTQNDLQISIWYRGCKKFIYGKRGLNP